MMLFLLGLVIGFLAAIPLGPVNIYVVSQTLKRDFFHGLLAGLTSSFLDGVYCLGAVIGIGHITFYLETYSLAIRAVAVVLLVAISWRLLWQASRIQQDRTAEKKSKKVFARPVIGVILLYVANPTLYGFWLAVAGSVTTHGWVIPSGPLPYFFALFCMFGSVTWYFLLVRYVSRHHEQIKPRTFRIILTVLALFLLLFAVYNLWSLLSTLISNAR